MPKPTTTFKQGALVTITPDGDMSYDDWGMQPGEFAKFIRDCEDKQFILLSLVCENHYWDVYCTDTGEVYDAICSSQFNLVMQPNR